MFVRLAKYLIRYRGIILSLLAVVTLSAAAIMPRVRFDSTPQAIFSNRSGLVKYSEQFKKTFG